MKLKTIGLFLIFICSCSENVKYRNVGDIPFIKGIDNPNFELCNENAIKQYYVRGSLDAAAVYKGEKKAIMVHFSEKCILPESEGQNGYITIRFIVNCNGETGRYRVQEMNLDYQPKHFDPEITEELLAATKELKGWIPVRNGEKVYDFYQYLTFRIENGQITNIMP